MMKYSDDEVRDIEVGIQRFRRGALDVVDLLVKLFKNLVVFCVSVGVWIQKDSMELFVVDGLEECWSMMLVFDLRDLKTN